MSTAGISFRRWRKDSRIKRFSLARSVACRTTRFGTASPSRGQSPLVSRACQVNSPTWPRRACWYTRVKSALDTSRQARGNDSSAWPAANAANQALRRARPLARRALTIARPFLVFIRARKPWVRFRLISLGWNVRFMMLYNSVCGARAPPDWARLRRACKLTASTLDCQSKPTFGSV